MMKRAVWTSQGKELRCEDRISLDLEDLSEVLDSEAVF